MVTASLIKGLIISSFAHFPKRLSSEAAFILSAQYRLTPPRGRRHPRAKIAQNKEFDMALKFLKIRSLVDHSLSEPYEWWSHQRKLFERHGHKHHAANLNINERLVEGQNHEANLS
jgi:poly(A) polymerase